MDEFTQVYEAYFRDVELYLRAICHDESLAEELTEQVFFKALKALPGFRGDCDIRVWLCAMARTSFSADCPVVNVRSIRIAKSRDIYGLKTVASRKELIISDIRSRNAGHVDAFDRTAVAEHTFDAQCLCLIKSG